MQSNYSNSQNAIGTHAEVPMQRNRLAALNERLEEVLEEVLEQSQVLAKRSVSLADRLLGSAPAAVGHGDPKESGSSEVRRLELTLERVVEQLSVVSTHLGRVEAL